VVKIQKKLEKMISRKEGWSQAKDLLNALRDTPITLEVLTKTRIGLTVNSLRKSSSDEDVISLAKAIIKHWKKLLEAKNDEKSKPDANGGNSNSSVSSSKGDNSNGNGKQAVKQEIKRETNTKSNDSKRSNSFPSDTANEVRLKCCEMISQALRVEIPVEDGDDLGDMEDIDELSAKIEDCIFREMKNTDMRYKNRVRSRVANLKDVKNPDLRLNVLRGSIKPDKIAVMTADEMASKDMKELRQKFTKESIDDHQMAVQGGTSSNLIKCPQCKKSNCMYNQVQTRSADEPMTTFCLCNECGKRWKFC
jgi:transcription elongation factor S-II